MRCILKTLTHYYSKGKQMSLYENINKRKKEKTSRPKAKSTITKKAYSDMKAGFPKKKGK